MTPTCIARIPGCAVCASEHTEDDHTCDDLCSLLAEMRIANKNHQHPDRYRHECGAPIGDELIKFCGYRRCIQIFCHGCRRYTGGWGPVGCPCDTHPGGHGTWAEFKRPGAGRLIKKSLNGRRRRG